MLHIFFNAHAHNCLISTSGLKSDVTIVFIDPNFLHDARIAAIRDHLRQKLAYLRSHRFSGPFGTKRQVFGSGRQNRGRGGAMLTPQRTRSYFRGLLPLCHFWRKSIKKCNRKSVGRHTDTQ